MTTGQRIILTVGIISVIGIGAYIWWKNYSFDDKYQYFVRGSSFKINAPRSASFALELDVINQFGVSGSLTGYNLKMSINQTQIADITSNVPVPLPKGERVPLTVSGTFDPLTSFKTIANVQMMIAAFTRPETVMVNIKGTFNIKINVSGVQIPLTGLPFDVTMSLKDFLPGVK